MTLTANGKRVGRPTAYVGWPEEAVRLYKSQRKLVKKRNNYHRDRLLREIENLRAELKIRAESEARMNQIFKNLGIL